MEGDDSCSKAVTIYAPEVKHEEPVASYSVTYFSYCSPPQPVPDAEVLYPRRPLYRKNVPKPRGIHDYYNMMWDPRVYRGTTIETVADEKEAENARILSKLKAPPPPRPNLEWYTLTPQKKKELQAERHLPAQLRAKRHIAIQMELSNQLAEASRVRKRARNKRRKEREEAIDKLEQIRKQKILLKRPTIPGTLLKDETDTNDEIVDETDKLEAQEEEYMRKLSLVSADSDISLRDDEPSLVELDMADRPSDDSQDEDEAPTAPKWLFPPVPARDSSIYADFACQTYPGEFFNFNENAADFISRLVANAVNDAIYELCIEEEQDTAEILLQQFSERRATQLQRMEHLKQGTKVVAEERLRLEQEAEMQEELVAAGKPIFDDTMFPSAVAGLADQERMRQLDSDGYFRDLYLHRVQTDFVPYINAEVEVYLNENVISRSLLDEIVKEVVTRRDEELVYANYKQPRTTNSGSMNPHPPPPVHSLSNDSFFNLGA